MISRVLRTPLADQATVGHCHATGRRHSIFSFSSNASTARRRNTGVVRRCLPRSTHRLPREVTDARSPTAVPDPRICPHHGRGALSIRVGIPFAPSDRERRAPVSAKPSRRLSPVGRCDRRHPSTEIRRPGHSSITIRIRSSPHTCVRPRHAPTWPAGHRKWQHRSRSPVFRASRFTHLSDAMIREQRRAISCVYAENSELTTAPSLPGSVERFATIAGNRSNNTQR